jgi:hypothetical protein
MEEVRRVPVRGRPSLLCLRLAGLLLLCAGPAAAQVVSGSYVGTGVAGRKITGLGFRPDVVLVKGNDYDSVTYVNTSAVMRTSTMGTGDVSKPLIQDYALVANQITSLDADGFTLGSDRRVAANGITFYWAAFKANANMKVGSYTGNGTADGTTQSITGLGFSPEFVIVMSSGAARALQACSAAVAGYSYEFDIGVRIGNQVTSLNADGFTVRHTTGATYVNASGVVYHYIAWNDSPGFVKVGSYQGNATDARAITGVAFRPDFLFVKFKYNINSPANQSPPGHFHTDSMPFDSSFDYARTVAAHHLQDLLPDGFQIGNALTINRTYTDCNVDGPGCEYFYVAIKNAVPPPLGATQTSTTITVTEPNSFEMTFDSAHGGNLSNFFDLSEDPTKLYDLAGKPSVYFYGLFHSSMLISGQTWANGTNSIGAKLDLLESTPTRAKVRQEAFYQQVPTVGTARLAGVKGIGDYSIYPEKVAIRWNRRAWATVTPAPVENTLEPSCRREVSPDPRDSVTLYSQSGSTFPALATDDFVLAKHEVARVRTDLLTILYQDWPEADSLTVSTTGTYFSWRDNPSAPVPAGSNDVWNLLIHYKPTDLGITANPWQDPAVTSRRDDYRGPDVLSAFAAGGGWFDASENTSAVGPDYFNESEAAYDLTLDPVNGLTFDMNGATTPRRKPFFKIRQWRSFVDYPTVTLEGTRLVKNVDFRADLKPVARAHYASMLVWHSTLESAAAVTSPDIGPAGTSSGTTYVAARYGNGALVDQDTDVITFPGSVLSASGAVEFWYQPNYACQSGSCDGARHVFWSNYTDGTHYFTFEKTAANSLFFEARNGSSASNALSCTVAAANFGWGAKDWVHLRSEWNGAATTVRIFVNGVEPTCTHAGSGSSFNYDPTSYVGTEGATGTANANGIIDELHVYRGTLAPQPLADGGLTSDANEYLASTANNVSLGLTVGAARDGGYVLFGSDSTFHGLNVALQTPGTWAGGTGDLVWEYWNGATGAWANLESVTGFTDGTASFTRDGSIYWTGDPTNWAPYSGNGGPDLYYVRVHLAAGVGYSTMPVEREIKTDILLFQYMGDITAAAQTFAFSVPTEVKLMSFTAAPGDGSVTLEWRTGSELDNLGFHLYRGPSADGPWTRLTSSLIPGLGSSPLGQAYSWFDSGLVNGTTYYYRLEDVDTSSKSTFHGPISAVPAAGTGTSPGPAPVTEPSPPGGDGDGSGGGDGSAPKDPSTSSCPSWVLSAAPDAVSPVCTRHGDPDSTSLQVLARDASSATLELHTGGFWTLREAAGEGQAEARVFVPGLEFPSDPQAPALPLRRTLVDAVVGKGVQLVSAEAFELRAFRNLRPSAVGAAEVSVDREGTPRPTRRALAVPRIARGTLPREVARLAGTVFQGDRKSAVVEITPVRFSGSGLVLAGRVRVRLAFTGTAPGESGTGSRGRALPGRGLSRDVLAQLHTSRRGLHAVTFEQLFPQTSRALSTALLRLQRQGEAVAFHVEPPGPLFGPGRTLYFYADRTASSTDYSPEVAYELVRSSGVRMRTVSAAPLGAPVASSSTGFSSFETNRIYQPGLLEAPDLWLWEYLPSGASRSESFALTGVDTASVEPARLTVFLQGGSESGRAIDHHVQLLANGALVGETSFAGKRPQRVELPVAASLLKEGVNELSVANVGDTGVESRVYLDRFEISYPQASAVRGGVFEGVWAQSGTAEVSGLAGVPVILRGSPLPGPEGSTVRWVTGFQAGPGSVRFQAEAGYRYLVVSPEGLLTPRVGRVAASTLKDRQNQADYLVIAPRELLEAASPLLERRRSQGLSSRAVAFEEIASEFGHGQPSAEAIKAFLSYAYHSWQPPSPRYVLLLGDSTDDPQRFLSTSWPSPLPALLTRTTYLWTVSDPALAAVNGEDSLPDLAIGRLPATTREQAEALVSKLLAWEQSGQALSGRAVFVADKPDGAGDFEADVEDVRASFLADRTSETLRVGDLGLATKGAILEAFDEGASLMSYVGHGGTAAWSTSGVLASWDAPLLRAQSRQSVLLTMNCLNGYFVAPNLDALPEALLKAEGRGVVAAVSPSGLSLDGPAHEYHRALVAELTSGRHQRLGDAVLAAQKTYADTGLMPELLEVYQLLGDPAMKIR